jgi:spore coat polysaccharide biosynthesis predicted glycosyltransferase SpsG
MKVAFFTEAGSKRGMGHLVRCQTIASEFIKNGDIVDFFLHSDIDYSYVYDNLHIFKWDSLHLEKFYDVIFIDSYEADISIYEKLSKKVNLTIAIDDYERINYPTKVIINFAAKADETFFKKREKEKEYLLGVEYIPIRDIFFNFQQKKEEKIFIMLGGSDTNNLSSTILEGLKNIYIKKVVVVNNEKAKELINYEDVEVLFKPTQKQLASQMMSSSYAITTASMSIYELSFLQIPTIIIAVSKNQIIGAPQIIKNGLAKFYVDITAKKWINILEEKMKILISRKEKSEVVIDGLGTKRIYEKINKWIKK